MRSDPRQQRTDRGGPKWVLGTITDPRRTTFTYGAWNHPGGTTGPHPPVLCCCKFNDRERQFMVEPLLSGIVLGLVPITISGLLVTAYLQYRRGDSLSF